MKSRLRALLLSLLILPAALHASTTAPMFAGSPGTTLIIQGETFTWTGPATEDGTWHYDTYTNTTGQTVTVTGEIGFPDLASVSGSTSMGMVAGYLSSGVYADNVQTSSEDGSWQFNGLTYTHREAQTTYSVNWTYQNVDYASVDDYSGSSGSLHFLQSLSYGNYETHFAFSGGTVPFSTFAQLTVFGTIYQFQESTSREDNYSDSNTASWVDKYTSLSGGTMQVSSVTNYGDTSYYIAVWDPHVGSMRSNQLTTVPDSSLTGVTWQVRQAPSFAKAQLWLDGKLLNWQSGTITTAGLLTDTYSGAGMSLTVSALTQDYFVTGSYANVTITSAGGGSGTVGHDGTFTLSGHVLQNATANHSAPFFVNGITILRVAGTNYAFTGAFQDSQGNRLDVYMNASLGTLTISGLGSDPSQGAVVVNRGGNFYSGTFLDGAFSVPSAPVIKPSGQPPIYGPPAFWARGELYLQNATTPTSYASASGHNLTLSGSSTWTLAGSDAVGAFSGVCSKDPAGVFLVQALDESSQPIAGAMVPVLPANADGSLHLSWEAPPTGMPPAVLDKNSRTLVYVGTAADDTSSAATAAYYGSATSSDQSDWLLKLRTDGSSTTPYTATYTDYGTATSTPGSYSAQTHLFQTATLSSGFPVPVYGVDPNANFALWGLTQPDSGTGLPATFLVQGTVWRYTGTDGSGAAVYQGYYSSAEAGAQVMTVAVPDADGARVVTVTDPFHGDGTPTQGTLNDVRGSARLRDGSEVYSGNFSGQQVNPTLNDHSLHTIAADLDITGNVVTFGALTGNAATAGVTLQFQDTANGDGSYTGSFYSMLARPQAQWLWARPVSSSGQNTLPVMKLDATHKLTLYDSPASGETQNPGVVLDPKAGGVSTLRGVLRVRPGGDIGMGDFTAGGQP